MMIRVHGDGWAGGQAPRQVKDKLYHFERIGFFAGEKYHRFYTSKMKHRTMIAAGYTPNKPYRK